MEGASVPQTPPELSQREHEDVQGCLDTLPNGLILNTKRSVTSLDTQDDGKNLLEVFDALNTEEAAGAAGKARMFGDSSSSMSTLEKMLQAEPRTVRRNFSIDAAGQQSATFAVGADPGLSVEDHFQPLREAARSLVRLGNSLTDGLRAFSLRFASLLRLTCPSRPGNDLLHKLLNAIIADQCYSYGNGTYRNPQTLEECTQGIEAE